MKRICYVDGCNNKVGIFAHWFGLKHCDECDTIFLVQRIRNTYRQGEEFLGRSESKVVMKYFDESILNHNYKDFIGD